ncbi:peptidoglycan DD-metalloendopeptidase family protein [Pontibacter akesuensis]|nr:peptidoglycan DD-metalloendopeptidase family protein [Pontibacter akesuensis]
MRRSNFINYIIYILPLLILAGCGKEQTLRGVFKNQTPHEKYAAKLRDAKLHETALGQQWLQEAQEALQDSITVTLPFKETGYFAADKPRALGYRIEGQRGQRLIVNLELKAREQLDVFLDLFEAGGGNATHVAAADSSTATLSYEVRNDQQHILRVQPELLRSGQYTLTIQSEPTLAFPVADKSSRNIASIWGDPRDAGVRRHEGIDVFARRGAPAIAATAGVVSRVSTTPRGGKVIWLTDPARRQSLYYAHLDSQLVQTGQRVQAGDTIGLIGNTGNAKGTGPHLHFGIYRYGQGATNPYPYVHQSASKLQPVQLDTALLGNWVRVAAKSGNVRLQPSTKSAVYQELPRHTPLLVTGGTANWYRVLLPTGAEAYIASSITEPATRPVRQEQLTAATDLLEDAHPAAAAMQQLSAGASIAILGRYNNYAFVRDASGQLGWINSVDEVSVR